MLTMSNRTNYGSSVIITDTKNIRNQGLAREITALRMPTQNYPCVRARVCVRNPLFIRKCRNAVIRQYPCGFKNYGYTNHP